MTTNTMTISCITCSGTGVDPGFGDECAPCRGTGQKMTAVAAKADRKDGPTEKQTAFAMRLLDDLMTLCPDKADAYTVFRNEWPKQTPKGASSLIDFLLGCVRDEKYKAAQDRAAAIEPGFYTAQGRVVKVQLSKSSGRPYAMLLNEATGKYEYAAGAMRYVQAENRLTIEQATEVSKRTGRCCICSRGLTNKHSVEAGIGPICAGKL